MESTSEYTFPIFISSTDYNLKDFRAELARFLEELGYRPILSSAEGFPDNSPTLEPWESCIQVLDQCFVMVLVIDGRYGASLEWKIYPEIFSGIEISPTHGEYLYAHNKRKRILVFIRKEVMTYYQSYRQAYKKCNKDDKEIKEVLEKVLPDYIDYETLKFVHQVKTTKPIPWIKEFDDITDVKKEVQKKMLNELAEIFLIKEKHLQTLIDSFNKVLDTVNPEEQMNILTRINATKPFVDAVGKTQELTKEVEQNKLLLEQTKEENIEDKEKYEKKIKELRAEIVKLEKIPGRSSLDSLFLKDGKVQLGSLDSNEGNIFIDFTSLYSKSLPKKCGGCDKVDSSSGFISYEHQYCDKCRQHFCTTCWPRENVFSFSEGFINRKTCPKCKAE